MFSRALAALAVSLLAALGPAMTPVQPAAVELASLTDFSIGTAPVPPKIDPKRDRVVPAVATSHIKGMAKPVPPTTAKRAARAACGAPCYFYAGRYRNSTNITGASTNASIITSSLDQQDYHTLWEMTIQNGAMILELGANRDRVVNGDTYPALTTHLFGSVWYDNGSGVRTFCGYNGGCGYVDYGANPINLGSDITASNNVLKQFMILHDATAHRWWLSYDGGWIGSFPDDLGHSNTFTTGTVIQTFDEIAAAHNPTCTDMGNSHLADKTLVFPNTGQQVSSLNEAVNHGSFGLAAYSGTIETLAAKWNVDEVSNYSSYYGGPGYSPNPGACP